MNIVLAATVIANTMYNLNIFKLPDGALRIDFLLMYIVIQYILYNVKKKKQLREE